MFSPLVTRIIQHGEVSWTSEDPSLDMPRHEMLPDPAEGNRVWNVGFIDGPWGLRYPEVDRVLPDEHWLTMPEMSALLQASSEQVAGWTQTGRIRAVVVRGSAVPLFRVKDALFFVELARKQSDQMANIGRKKRKP